jgi:hypothetical protein
MDEIILYWGGVGIGSPLFCDCLHQFDAKGSILFRFSLVSVGQGQGLGVK